MKKKQKIAIILRKSETVNIFREIILDCFQEKQGKKSFLASDHFKDRSPSCPCQKTVTIVGVYNRMWQKQYDAFVLGIENISCPICGKKIPVVKKKIKDYHWHAKVFIASRKGDSEPVPVIGIIWSSNITSRAFGLLKEWNYEADIILWDDSDKIARRIISAALEPITADTQHHIIVSNYATQYSKNFNLTLQERLQQLRREIEAESVTQ